MKVCSVDEMRSIDRRAAQELGIPSRVIMENAGLAACDVVRQETGTEGRFVVLCGLGDNGGAGLVAARKLNSLGAKVTVFVFGDPGSLEDSAKDNFEAMRRSDVAWGRFEDHEQLRRALHGCTAVIDALLGTGLDRDVSGDVAEAVALTNRASCPVIALDIPTGVCGDTGRIRGTAIRADATLAFGLPKRGNLLPPGRSRAGRLYVTHLALSPALQAADDVSVELAGPAVLPERSPHGHKGTFGDTLIVAGAGSYFGAPGFAAMACLRAGGGYARLACPRSLAPTIATLAPEVVFVPQRETVEGTIARDNLVDLLELAKGVDFVIVGPGLSTHAATQALVLELVAGIDQPMLIDGDGITAVAKDPAIVASRKSPTVLTPHPGEMARLLGVRTRQVLSDPIAAARAGAERWGADMVLKGASTLVARPDGHVSINTTGNDGMGTAGSGDVLTGTIAAMVGLGLKFHDAVVAGVFIHGLAGDLAKGELGADGMTARDILSHLPMAVREYRALGAEFCGGSFGLTRV